MITFLFLSGSLVWAEAARQQPELNESLAQVPSLSAKGNHTWAQYFPYVPEKSEYNFEMGAMWEETSLAWFGATYGQYLRQCYWVSSEKCQQYLDFTLGLGHTQGTTLTQFLVGPRWQYVLFPKPFSPSVRIFAGLSHYNDSVREFNKGVYGAEFALTMSLHKKLNIKWDNRIAGGDHVLVQTFVSFSLKIDDWVDQFGDKIKKVSHSTVETTGSILKSTIQAPNTLIEWFNKPKTEEEK